MTYLAKRQRVAKRPSVGLSGMFDWLPTPPNTCLNEANAAVAPLDAKVMDLAKNWNPSGFYAPADLQKIVVETMSLVRRGSDTVAAAPLSTSDARSQIQQALTKLSQQGQRSMVYVKALQDATASGANIINAAGLKTWVLDTMQAVSSALVTAGVMECHMPWLATAIIAFQGYFDVLAAVVKRVVGVVLKLGDNVLKVADHAGDILTFLKWAVIIGGGAWGVMEIRRRRGV